MITSREKPLNLTTYSEKQPDHIMLVVFILDNTDYRVLSFSIK